MSIKVYSILLNKKKRFTINNHIFINVLDAKQVSRE